ncbi:MAG: DNA-processing protein DprA, partial [Oscillospiraceae bacterium]|nr:DNA-processing protein DprA [Oscillospiraceae bacterium]
DAKAVIAKRGLVITEFFPGTRPDRHCFHVRNRIISGLTFGTIVTEADERSGSLITAEHATEQGRTVFCIPPADIFDKRYSGVVKYLRDGAVPVFNHLDILYDYYTSSYFRMLKSEFEIPELNYEEQDIPKRDSRTVRRKTNTKPKTNPQVQESENKAEASDEEKSSWEALLEEMEEEHLAVVGAFEDDEGLMLDEIVVRSGLDPISIFALMTELEMMGAVRLCEGRKYRLCKK